MARRGPERWQAYVAAVTLSGLVALVVVLGAWATTTSMELPATFWLFTAFVVAGELFPIVVPREQSAGQITTSTTFAFALLLADGTGAALLGLVAGSVIADTIQRTAWWKAAFNAAQFSLALLASGTVLAAFTGRDLLSVPPVFSNADLPAIVLAGAVFALANSLLFRIAVVLMRGVSLRSVLSDDPQFDLWANTALLSLSPVVVAAAERSLALVPLLAIQMAVAYKSVQHYFEKEHQALHDDLTGLPNRTLFRDRIEQHLRHSPRNGHHTAVLICDLDRFKEINDTLGHQVGDVLLAEIGRRLVDALPANDTVARLGGDEFGVVLGSLPEADAVEQVAHTIRSELERPFAVQGITLDVEGSVGIAVSPEHGDDADTLMRRADVAMYIAKRTHSGSEVYAPELDEYSPDRLAQLGNLRRALEEGHLRLFFQPKSALADGEVRGAEALVRWMDPERGLISPAEFIPLAERTGLIRPLTLHVLTEAVRQVAAWHAAGFRLGVAVNVSARNLHDLTMPDQVDTLLRQAGVAPEWLQLEITESTIMADPVRALRNLTRLRDMGVELSIDDFGTGHSSLTYLKQLPVDEIKIDRSFVAHMRTNTNDAVIVRSTIDLGRNLGLRVVAEGVEDEATWRELAALGCDIAQGYYLSRPIPPAELLEWLRSDHAPLRGNGAAHRA